MDEFFQNPIFQSVIAPFVVALVVAELFQRMRLSGLAVIAAFCCVLILANDFVLWPLTAARKLILVSLVVAALGIAFDSALRSARYTVAISTLVAALAAAWVLWSPLSQLPHENRLQLGGGVILFVIWIVAASDGLRSDSVRASAAGWGLGLGAGVAAWLAASDLLGKFGVAIGCASAAYLFIQSVSGLRLPSGRTYVLPMGLISSLVAATAVMVGHLTWVVLPLLALIPLLVRLAPEKNNSVRLQTGIAFAIATLPAAAAVLLAWRSNGLSPV